MTLAPFHAAPWFIQTHIVAALLVLALTPVQFFGFRKGSMPHRMTGYLWLAAMTVVAISSFWITKSGLQPSLWGYSLIHLLSVFTLVMITLALYYAREGRASAHRKTLIGVTIGFLIAGVFTLAPGRIMGRILFEGL